MDATLSIMTRPRKEETETVRVAKSVARKVRILAVIAGKTLPDYLSERLGQCIDKEYTEVMGDRAGKPGKGRKS
jgi:hypothetical protein